MYIGKGYGRIRIKFQGNGNTALAECTLARVNVRDKRRRVLVPRSVSNGSFLREEAEEQVRV